jgi:hypothetical protein
MHKLKQEMGNVGKNNGEKATFKDFYKETIANLII